MKINKTHVRTAKNNVKDGTNKEERLRRTIWLPSNERDFFQRECGCGNEKGFCRVGSIYGVSLWEQEEQFFQGFGLGFCVLLCDLCQVCVMLSYHLDRSNWELDKTVCVQKERRGVGTVPMCPCPIQPPAYQIRVRIRSEEPMMDPTN